MREYVSVRDSVSDPNVSYIPVEWGKSAIDQQQKKKSYSGVFWSMAACATD